MDENLARGRGKNLVLLVGGVSGDTPTLRRCAVEQLRRRGGHGAVVAWEGDDCRDARVWQGCSAVP